MKLLLTLLFLIPSLSWGAIYDFNCKSDFLLDQNGTKTKVEESIWNFQIDLPKKKILNQGYDPLSISTIDNGILTTERVTKNLPEGDFAYGEFYFNKNEFLTIYNHSKGQSIRVFRCNNNSDFLIAINSDANNSKKLDIKNQCLEFGFQEGTDGFANCQLQLTILEKQSNNSNDITKYDERLIESLDEISKTVKKNKLMLDKQTFDKMLNQSKNYSLGKCQYLWDC